MESENFHVQDQTILISDDDEHDMLSDEENMLCDEDDMLCDEDDMLSDEDETTSDGKGSVIIISDDNKSNCSDIAISSSDSDSESDYIRITNRPGPKSKTRIKRPNKSNSENIKKKRRIDNNHYTDTDISSDCDTDANICSDVVSKEKSLETSNDYDENDSQDSVELICPNECDTDNSDENESETEKYEKLRISFERLDELNKDTDVNERNKIYMDILDDVEKDNERKERKRIALERLDKLKKETERDRISLETLSEHEKVSEKYDVENKLLTKVFMDTPEKDLEKNIDAQENRNDDVEHDSEELISSSNCDTNISLETLNELENETEQNEVDKMSLETLSELEKIPENYNDIESIIRNELVPQVFADNISLQKDGQENKNEDDSDKQIVA